MRVKGTGSADGLEVERMHTHSPLSLSLSPSFSQLLTELLHCMASQTLTFGTYATILGVLCPIFLVSMGSDARYVGLGFTAIMAAASHTFARVSGVNS